jgi:hypothetical protein
VIASDGEVGRVLDAFFDERSWQIRFLLIKMSCVSRDRIVLFPPEAVVSIDPHEGVRIERLPALERKPAEHMGSLRSAREMLDCTVAGWSGDIGRTEDVLFDEASWALCFLMINAGSWRPGTVVFVRSDLVEEVRWERQSLSVAITRAEVVSLPTENPADVDLAHDARVLH